MTDLRYDYGPDTLRGIIARVVVERANQIMAEVAEQDGDGVYADALVTDVGRVLETEAPPMYDRLMEVMDPYLDDWANTVAENLGFVQ